MARALTENETAVLAHVVHRPDLWWKTVSEATNLHMTAEEALAAKVEKYQPDYAAASGEPGYQTRLARDIADPGLIAINSVDDV